MIKETFFLSGINLTGKVLGLIKIVVLAAIYGAGSLYDAYTIAYTLPTIIPQVLTTIISTIFIPQFYKHNRESKESWEGLNVLFTGIVIFSISSTLVLYFYADSLVSLLAPGIDDGTFSLAVELFEIMSITTMIIGISSYFIALANATNRFYLASLDSLIINSLVITYCLIYKESSKLETITELIIIGFSLHLFILLISNRHIIFTNIRFCINFRHEDFISPMSKALPIFIGYVGAISSGIVDQWFSSFEDSGSIAILSYATMLYILPMEVFGKAIMQTYYTKFSSLAGNIERIVKAYSEGIRIILLIIIPTTVFLISSNNNLVSLVFERGEFNSNDTTLTSNVLVALSLSLLFRIITYFNYRLLHSIGYSWSAIIIGIFGVIVNIIFNYLLAPVFGLVGIALATSISLLISFVVSALMVNRIFNIRYGHFINFNTLKIIIASTLSAFIYTIVDNTYINTINDGSYVNGMAYNILLLSMFPAMFISFSIILKINELKRLYRLLGFRQ